MAVEDTFAAHADHQDQQKKCADGFKKGVVEIVRRQRGPVHGDKQGPYNEAVDAHNQDSVQHKKSIFRHGAPL